VLGRSAQEEFLVTLKQQLSTQFLFTGLWKNFVFNDRINFCIQTGKSVSFSA
jgi:hypothetical protein